MLSLHGACLDCARHRHALHAVMIFRMWAAQLGMPNLVWWRAFLRMNSEVKHKRNDGFMDHSHPLALLHSQGPGVAVSCSTTA